MKSSVWLYVVAFMFTVTLPHGILRSIDDNSGSAVQADTCIAVRHSEGDDCSEMNVWDLAFYETVAQISYDAPSEAIKAQALASLTTVWYQHQTGEPYQSTCLPFPEAYSQEYWKKMLGDTFESAMTLYRQAFEQVKHQKILYNGEPIMALTHAVNSGKTENGAVLLGKEVPYLQSVASPADTTSPLYKQVITYKAQDVKKRLEDALQLSLPSDPGGWMAVVDRTSGGTALRVTVGDKELTGYDIQSLFSLPSAALEVTAQNEEIVLTVYGKGHAVGMSTCGAIALAQDGQTYEQILQYYYNGVSIQ